MHKLIVLITKEKVWILKIGGIILTFIVISLTGLATWHIEQITINDNISFPSLFRYLILIFFLSSALAAKSLEKGVLDVIDNLPSQSNVQNLNKAKSRLQRIVGREVEGMDRDEIIRATVESASENAVDGVFGPLFWMIIGSCLWGFSKDLPGPLSMAWMYKAGSTIDSMIGYKYGYLRWLGSAGARFEDALTWIPCRLVMFTLPIISKNLINYPKILAKSFSDGSKYSSPNAGNSQAIFAHCVGIRMGGENKYKGRILYKPIIAKGKKYPDISSVRSILDLTYKLEISWLVVGMVIITILY